MDKLTKDVEKFCKQAPGNKAALAAKLGYASSGTITSWLKKKVPAFRVANVTAALKELNSNGTS